MVACLGAGVQPIVDAWAEQAERISYFYNHHFTSEPQEQLADRLLEVVAPGMARVRLVSGGSEANETALQLARLYHVERGDTARWRVISPAQSYHGSTMGTLALSGRPSLQQPFGPYLASHLHIPPSTWRFDPTGEEALATLDQVLDEAGPETIAAFFIEPVSAAALPAYSPPDRFWTGLDERRREHGFLICFDEVVSGIGRVGTWLAADQLPIEPDIVSIGEGPGCGVRAARRRDLSSARVRRARPGVPRVRPRPHVGRRAAVVGRGARGPGSAGGTPPRGSRPRARSVAPGGARGRDRRFRTSSGRCAGRGFLLGVELVDPRDGESFLPVDLDVASLVDDTAVEHGLLVTSTHPQADRFAGDQTLLAPAYVTSDEELTEIVDRFRATIEAVERSIEDTLGRGRCERRRRRGGDGSRVRPPRDPGHERLAPGQGAPARRVRERRAPRHRDDRPDLGLDPVDHPIEDYETFGIKTGAADLLVHPEEDTLRDLSWRPGLADLPRHTELARREPVRHRVPRGLPLGPRRRRPTSATT